MPPDAVADLRDQIDALRRQGVQSKTDKAWQTASRAAVALLVPTILSLASWLSAMSERINQNATSIKIIQETRFTAEMGHSMQANIMREIAKSYPPRWLQDGVARLESSAEKVNARIEGFDHRLDRIEATLTAIEARK